jgi:CRISPR/Cas system-associated exonuclease Cas4 (RecB family)
MGIIDWLFGKRKKRARLQDVKIGQSIQIEWSRIVGGFGWVKCIGNDTKKKTLLLRVHWVNYKEVNDGKEYETFVVEYKSQKLANFHLLNQYIEEDETDEDYYINELEKIVKVAIKEEEYEKVTEIQNKINKFLAKK